jgi:hypothetical protein
MDTPTPRYWFRAKSYGLGWGLPLTWQGWVFFLSWLAIVSGGVIGIAPRNRPMRWAFLAVMILLFIAVCYWKGDPRGRRWNSGEG